MKKHICILIGLLLSGYSFATIINIPDEHPTIQAGINVSVDGDTVLVDPGIYVENINFNGKNITVASQYLTTLDTTYISQTIIDGDSVGSVVIFNNMEDSTAVFCGFTITHGDSYKGGGIHCKNSSPTLKNLIVKENVAIRGGGIYIENSTVHIYETEIVHNRAIKIPGGGTQPDAFGGGVRCYEASPVFIDVNISNNVTIASGGYATGGGISCLYSYLVLQNVKISDNVAVPKVTPSTSINSSGGGIASGDSMYLSNVTITGNYAKNGGGIYGGPDIVFDTINRCNIYLNKADLGNDFYGSISEVIVDTFTVLSPTGFHAYPPEDFSFNINTGFLEQQEADLYVSPQGDITNSGLSVDQPLLNTWSAFSKILVDSLHPHTIHLAGGIYSQENNEEMFPFRIQDYISIGGESQENVILDADSNSNVIVLDNVNDIHIAGLTITGGYAVNGGGIESNFSNVMLQNLTIKDNTTFWNDDGGGGIYCNNSLLELQNITIKENISDKGGGIFVAASNPVIQNCTIDSNFAAYGGGMYCFEGAIPVLKNTTIKNNKASEKGGGLYNDQSTPGFDETNRSNIYFNYALFGNDLYSDTTIHVVVDTFTVLNPNGFHAEPFQNFTFDILHGKVDQVDADLYVSPTGDNSNSGLSTDEPLKTIWYALSSILPDSISQNTIQLLEGTFSTSENGEIFPINLPDYVNLQGVSQNDVILNAEGQSGVMIIDNNETNNIAGLTITGGTALNGCGISINYSNPTIQDVSIINNTINNSYSVWSNGGGIYCSYSNPILQNLNISNNSSTKGGGIYCSYSNPHMQNVTISNNSTVGYNQYGGGIYCYNSDPYLQGVTISGNSSSDGGGIFCNESNPVIQNTDILNNTANGYQEIGGGGICCINSNPVLQEVNILNNTAYAYSISGGGGVCCINSSPSLTDVIISGNLSTNGGGIYLEDSNPEMHNVTISNNSTDSNNSGDIGGGGICCKSSSPLLQNVQIDSNYSERNGGGMVCSSNSSPTFIDVTIIDNSTHEYEEYSGGGIYCINSSTDFENVLIQGNYAPKGGGFYCSSSSIQELELVTIKNNSATRGGGIYCSSSDIEFHNSNRCNIYFNNAIQGNDLFSDVLMDVVVDTFSVLLPTNYYAQPIENFTFDILNGKIEQIDADLYVSPYGDNENSGLSSSEPLKNIWFALSKILADSLHPHIVYLLNGTYSPSINEEIYPLNVSDYISLTGTSESSVILDAEGQSGVMMIDQNTETHIAEITITGGSANKGGGLYCNYSNPTLQNVTIINNSDADWSGMGAGIYCYYSSPDLQNVTILNNIASEFFSKGGGIYCYHSSPSLQNVTLLNNSATEGGGIYCEYSNPNLQNVIISENTVLGSGGEYGGGIACINESNPIFQNVIISNNSAIDGGGIYCDSSSPYIKNTLISDNYASSDGGGINCFSYSDPILMNVQITDNIADNSGGGIACFYDCNPTLINLTLSNNSATYGGGIYCNSSSDPELINTISWDNSPQEIYFYIGSNNNSITIAYSDIQGGEDGIVTNGNGSVNWLAGNIDLDPLFSGSGDYPFSLSDESPCVNAGMPDTTGLFLPELDLAGNSRYYGGRIDMGAYENQNISTSITKYLPPYSFEFNCSPNPFSDELIIKYNLPESDYVRIEIYNPVGKKIEILINAIFSEGKQIFNWKTDNLSPGIYFIRLQFGVEILTRKIIKL